MNIVMGEDVLSPARVKEDLNGIRRELEQKLSNQIAQHTVITQLAAEKNCLLYEAVLRGRALDQSPQLSLIHI